MSARVETLEVQKVSSVWKFQSRFSLHNFDSRSSHPPGGWGPMNNFRVEIDQLKFSENREYHLNKPKAHANYSWHSRPSATSEAASKRRVIFLLGKLKHSNTKKHIARRKKKSKKSETENVALRIEKHSQKSSSVRWWLAWWWESRRLVTESKLSSDSMHVNGSSWRWVHIIIAFVCSINKWTIEKFIRFVITGACVRSFDIGVMFVMR